MPATRTPFVVGNWKMNGLRAALGEIDIVAAAVSRGEAGRAAMAICPPATLICRAVDVAGDRMAIGGQDCAVPESGAHTGDISAEMLRDAGATLVILGHSERRADHNETNVLVRHKVQAARRAGLLPIVCVGESRSARDKGQLYEVVGNQLDGSLPADCDPEELIVAYEPVWAIGSGRTASEADVARMHGFIRRQLVERFGAGADAIRLLYGGSVKPDNASALMAVDNVDGALVGGASLKSGDFLGIAAAYR